MKAQPHSKRSIQKRLTKQIRGLVAKNIRVFVNRGSLIGNPESMRKCWTVFIWKNGMSRDCGVMCTTWDAMGDDLAWEALQALWKWNNDWLRNPVIAPSSVTLDNFLNSQYEKDVQQAMMDFVTFGSATVGFELPKRDTLLLTVANA